MVLNDAHNQWATRPSDQRFWTLQALHEKMTEFKRNAKVVPVSTKSLRVESLDQKALVLRGTKFGEFELTIRKTPVK